MASTLRTKLQLKDDARLVAINLNDELNLFLLGIPLLPEANPSEQNDVLLLCIEKLSDINLWFPKLLHQKNAYQAVWLAYPKKSGANFTRIGRDELVTEVTHFQFDPVRLISINKNWSAVRLVHQAERRQPSTFGKDPKGIDRKSKTVIPPEDLQIALDAYPEAKLFFEGLAFSHKREYVSWILEAKKEDTRKRRIEKTIELLAMNRKAK